MKYIGQDPAVLDNFVTAVANGAISSGDPCVVDSTGTVAAISGGSATTNEGSIVTFNAALTNYINSVYDTGNSKTVTVYKDSTNYPAAIVGTPSATSIGFGTENSWESNNTNYHKICYDANSGKIICAYERFTDSKAYIVIGTVSGTSISFGTPVEFYNANIQDPDLVYDPSSQKSIIFYRDNSSQRYGRARVITVSGTSATLGTETVFNTARSEEKRGIYDVASEQVVLFYRDLGNSGYLTAKVATVSGTSISFSSSSVLSSSYVVDGEIGASYDTEQDKIVVCFANSSNSDYGTAVVCSVSGSSVTYGTPVVFESAATIMGDSVDYNVAAKKHIFAYRDSGNLSRGTRKSGTVSGTSITFDSAYVFETGTTNWISIVYDPVQKTNLIFFQDAGNSSFGKAHNYREGYNTLNLTAENFIGFADKDYADGADAVIQAKGAVNDKQTSLTAGQSYFVQTDGTIGTTADDPSVFAGTAVSATQLIVKG